MVHPKVSIVIISQWIEPTAFRSSFLNLLQDIALANSLDWKMHKRSDKYVYILEMVNLWDTFACIMM